MLMDYKLASRMLIESPVDLLSLTAPLTHHFENGGAKEGQILPHNVNPKNWICSICKDIYPRFFFFKIPQRLLTYGSKMRDRVRTKKLRTSSLCKFKGCAIVDTIFWHTFGTFFK